MDAIILQGTTSQELVKLINEGVKTQLDDLKKELKISNPDEILTRTEAADFLKVNLSTLHLWTKKGKITAFGISHRRYYKKENLLACLTQLKN